MNFLNRLMGRGNGQPPQTPYTPINNAADPWDLDTTLLYLSENDPFSIRNACEGVQIFGGIGSGKTSGSGAALARSFLAAGFGGLVCCAKPEERQLWEQYARETRRSDYVIVVEPGGKDTEAPYRFNFLDYEINRSSKGGGLTENAVTLLTQVIEIVEGKQGPDGDGGFWKRGMNELLRNAVDIINLAGEALTLDNVCQLVLDAPSDPQQPHDAGWQASSYTFKCIMTAVERPNKSARQENDFNRAASYWLKSFPETPDRTRGGIVATFRGVADVLLHGIAWELLATDTNIVPEMTYRDGAIIILDLSIQEYREVGRTVQAIWKTMFQQAILRRDANAHPRPVFLWADESQNFVTTVDKDFLQTSRSARCSMVYLTQNMSNYHARLGHNAKADADALLGTFVTKIFHAQSDHATNQYAADLIGKHWTKRNSRGVTAGQQSGPTVNTGMTDSLEYKIEPSQFTILPKGGPSNQRQVGAVVFQSGRIWNQTNDTYLLAVFAQE